MSTLPNKQKMQVFESAVKQEVFESAVKQEVFESAVKQEEDPPIRDIPVRIEIDVRSISSFVKAEPDTLIKMWDEVQHDNINEDKLLRGDQLNNFLHDILKKWYKFYRPREKARLVKSQTRAAVGEFKQLISATCEESNMIDFDTWVLSKKHLSHFVEQMKQRKFDREDVSITKAFEFLAGKVFEPTDSGAAVPSARQGESAERGVDVLYQNFKNPLIEPPIQKFRRLESEVSKFQASLRELANQKEAMNNGSTKVSVSNAKSDLGKLSDLVLAVPGEQPDDSRQLSFTASDLLFSKLSSHLEGGRSQAGREQSEFSLFSKGSLESEQNSEIKNLETRLENLEKISGKPFIPKDAMTTIAILSQPLNVLADSAKLQSLEQQVSKLIKELDQLKSKSNPKMTHKRLQPGDRKKLTRLVPPAERKKIARVEMMFKKMSTWEKAAEQLPIAIERLQNLQHLNMEASGVVEQVNTLREQQATLTETLADDRRLLQSVYKRLVSSTEKIRANVKSLDDRILKLKNS